MSTQMRETEATADTPVSQAEHAYKVVLEMLLSLEIPPGAAIVEADLIRATGVGKTPIRDSLRRLESEKLVRIYPRRGTFASEVGLGDLSLIADLREGLEGLAAATAARRAGSQDRKALNELAQRIQPQDPVSQMDDDLAVHRAVYRSAHNVYLEETALKYLNLSTRIWRMYVDRLPERVDAHMEEHREMLRVIARGDEEEAERRARAHVRGFEAAIQEVM